MGFMQSCFPLFVYFKCLSEFLLYFYKSLHGDSHNGFGLFSFWLFTGNQLVWILSEAGILEGI